MVQSTDRHSWSTVCISTLLSINRIFEVKKNSKYFFVFILSKELNGCAFCTATSNLCEMKQSLFHSLWLGLHTERAVSLVYPFHQSIITIKPHWDREVVAAKLTNIRWCPGWAMGIENVLLYGFIYLGKSHLHLSPHTLFWPEDKGGRVKEHKHDKITGRVGRGGYKCAVLMGCSVCIREINTDRRVFPMP